MFSPKPTTGNSRISNFTSSRPASNRRSSSMFTPRNKSRSSIDNRSLVRNRSVRSSILAETTEYTIEYFGLSLPVLVTEALTLADRSTCVSVRIDSSGWAWLVGGRKLFVWRYKQSPHIRYQQCHELMLPPSDLAHNADRVCVIPPPTDRDDTQRPVSCVAVSPEGVVRYWPNVAHEASSVEISAQLGGEECATVLNFEPYGCMLATTTSSLLLLVPSATQNTVTCRSLKAGQGMFSGISRRMSSFFFGSGQTQMIDAPLQRLLDAERTNDERMFYMLSGGCVQKWALSQDRDRVICQADVNKLFKETCARKIWEQDSSRLSQLKVWILDIQLSSHGLMVVGAATNPEVSPSFYYAIGYVNMDSAETPTCLNHFLLLDYAEVYREEELNKLLAYKLLVPQLSIDVAYMHHKSQVLIVSSEPGAGPVHVDKAEFRSPGESLLGAGSCNGVAVFFSSSHGLVSISTSQQHLRASMSMMDESLQDSVLMESSGINSSLSQARKLSLSSDKSERFKAAFLMSFSGEMSQVEAIIDELYPDLHTSTTSLPELDQLVINLSTDVIDDYPASDPRWADSHSAKADSTSSTSSLIIVQQLRDKQKAHSHVINFLKKTRIWDKLTNAPTHDGIRCTKRLLCEHVEKIVAACALRELHAHYADIVDSAIVSVLERRQESESRSNQLTPQDLFYRSVSRVHEIFGALVLREEEAISRGVLSSDLVTLIAAVNTLIENMFQDSLEYRKAQHELYEDSLIPSEYYREFVPWTSAETPNGGRTMLRKQFNLTVEHAIPKAKNIETRGELFQQILSDADVLLAGYVDQITTATVYSAERARDVTALFEQERHRLVAPFLHHKQYERAASLAEKYHDFTTLIRICDVTDNEERLQRYQEQFSNKGFSEELFNWYLKEGKRGKLLSHSGGELGRFLSEDRNKPLRWLNDIKTHNFTNAHQTLLDLALNEEQHVFKRKTLLSLSKLAALASDDATVEMDNNIKFINEEHHLILHQEDLPHSVLEDCGMDPGDMRVLSAEEIIELMIGDSNVAATEYDFSKALDLLIYVTDEGAVEPLRQRVWCKAILRDSWVMGATDDPLDVVRNMIVFKVIDNAFTEGADLHSYLPDIDTLLAHELLADLSHNKSFEFLLRAGYEQIHEIIAKT